MGYDFDVIVVGAGIAGLAAARRIHDAGLSVMTLEARDRIGGRVHSQSHSGRVTDLGASWIHGIEDSELYDTVKEFGMRTVEFTVGSYQAGGRPIAYYGPNGLRLSDSARAEFIADVEDFDALLLAEIEVIEAGTSYGDAVEKALVKTGWAAQRAERVREFMRHRTEEQYGAWIEALDAHGLDDDFFEGDEVVFPDGYGELAEHLSKNLDVRLQSPVTEVKWEEDGVHVVTAGVTFAARRAIVTVPVGVLQSPDFKFEPSLPATVQGALNNLQMNAFEKIFLTFETKFWDQNVYAIRRQGEAAKWWHSWYDLSELDGTPTLLTFAAGPCAEEIINWTDEAITASVLDSLREIYGPEVSQPTQVTVTRWQNDPWSRGSYAYMTVGSETQDHERLAVTIGGVLQLAGEATWIDDPATVSAALLSGRRAADTVLLHEPHG